MRICAQVLGRSHENNSISCNFYEFVLGVCRAKSPLQTKLISAAPLSDQICLELELLTRVAHLEFLFGYDFASHASYIELFLEKRKSHRRLLDRNIQPTECNLID